MSNEKEYDFILASASPRRKELLLNIGLRFKTVIAECDETIDENITPENAVMLNSLKKAVAAAQNVEKKPAFVIGADTIVVFDGKILTKPKNEEDAFNMLKSISGKEHSVLTGLSVLRLPDGKSETVFEETRVHFKELSDDEIIGYIKTKEPMDKAGAYGIQGLAGMFIDRIDGDYFNVVGLPISRLFDLMKNEFNINIMIER